MCGVFALIGLNRNAAALDMLESMYQERDSQILMLRVSPIYDLLRREKRFQQLLTKTHLWQEADPTRAKTSKDVFNAVRARQADRKKSS